MTLEGRVLVTGAAGFVGFEVAQIAAEQGYKVTALDALLDGLYPAKEKSERWEKLEEISNIKLLQADLRTFDWTNESEGFDYVINLAAMPGLALSWSEFDLYRSCNFDAVARLLEASKNWPVKKFLQVSTSSVYGLNAIGDESGRLQPVSPYGVTKLAAEQLALAYHRTFDLPVSILRYFSVYGPGQRPDMAYRRFISSAIRNEPITLFGDGSQSRTNTFVLDVAKATVDALAGSHAGQTYNLSGCEEITIEAALAIILEATNSSSLIVTKDRVPGDQDRTFGNSDKAKAHFSFRPRTPLRQGLMEQVAWASTK